MATPSARKTSTPPADTVEAPATPAVVETAPPPVPAEIPPAVLWRIPTAGAGLAVGNPHLTRHENNGCSLAITLQRPAGSPAVPTWQADLDALARATLTTDPALSGLLADRAILREKISSTTLDLHEVDTRLAATEGSLADPALSDSPNLGQRLRELHDERDRLQVAQREGSLVLAHLRGQDDRLASKIGGALGPVAERVVLDWLTAKHATRDSILAELVANNAQLLERFYAFVMSIPPDVSAVRSTVTMLAAGAAEVRMSEGYSPLS